MRFFNLNLASVFALGLLSPVACIKSENEGESQGTYQPTAINSNRTAFDVCWHASSAWIDTPLRKMLQDKVLEQYNGRTPIRFRFLEAPCPAARTKLVRLESMDGLDPTHCPQNSAATAHAFLDFPSRTPSGVSLGPGTSFVFCRMGLATMGSGIAPRSDLYEKEMAVVVLHELGHTLGLGHEQERPDVETEDPECHIKFKAHIAESRAIQVAYATLKQQMFGAFDKSSIMNYCNVDRKRWKTPREVVLSDGDVALLSKLYRATAKPSDDTAYADLPADATPEPEGTFSSDPRQTARKFVHCDEALLRRCLQFGGGAGCLDTTRAEKECVGAPAGSRRAVPLESTRACMLSQATAAQKTACVF